MGDTPIPPAEGDSPSALPLVAAGDAAASEAYAIMLATNL
jgi:hypothetical protein